MSFIFKYTLFSLQGHICLLQGHKVCTRTRYFNACRDMPKRRGGGGQHSDPRGADRGGQGATCSSPPNY